MRHLHRSALIAAGIALSLTASGIASLSASAAVAPGASTSASTITPVGAAPVIPAGATSDGTPPSTEHVGFEVVLRPRDQAGLDAFTTAVSTPGSPSYHQFLAPGDYASRFGPSASTIANVTSALGKLGLTVGAAQGSILPVSGALSIVGSALHTAFRQYRLSSGRIARANVGAPQVPTSVAGAVQAVVGLDNLAQVSHPVPNVRVLDPTGDDTGLTPAVTPDLTGPTCSAVPGGAGYYNAGQLASYYGLTASYTAGTLGSGITVAIVELEPYLASDIANYQSCYSTNATVTNVPVNGGPGTGDGSGEAALDIEDVIGLAPQAAIRVYEGPLAATASDADVLAIYTAIANDDIAQVVTTSWGACESRTSPTLANGENTVFQQMAAQGQSMFAATGDSGSADCDTGTSPSTALAVDDPASQPFVTGVGGTNLASTTGPESAWNNGIVNSAPHAGGGGVSAKWHMPSWQTSLGNISGSTGTPCGATGGTLCREVPDVSASADPNDGYAIYYTPPASPPGHPAGFYAFGGTSAAAPTWAALTALIDATCGGQRLGLINPALYQLRATGTADFHDVTTGNNDATGTNGGAYAAASGYDMATGLGTPVGSALRTDLCPAAAADGSGTMTAAPGSVGTSTSTTVQLTYTAPAGAGLTNGEITVVVPTGWSAPSTTATSAGFTTASSGRVSIASRTIQIQGVTTIAGGTVKITYGDTSSGGPGAVTPTTAGTSTFTAADQHSTGAGALTALASSPQIGVGVAADGSGTLGVSPSSVAVTTPTTLTFTYAPPSGTALTSGAITVAVPSGWTPPQSTNSSAAGFVTASTGTLAVSGSTIRVDPVTTGVNGTVTITYGSTSAGAHPAGAAVPPSSPTTSTFSSQQRGTAGGTLTSLASSPSVLVGGGGGGSSGGGGGGGGGAAPSTLTLLRVAGTDRVGTSIAASQTGFPTADSARAVVLARSDTFADALAGAPLAVGHVGPLLLTGSTALSAATATEIKRVLAPGGTVFLLGGNSAITPAVQNAVAALGYPTVRIAGPDRYATAVQIASYLGDPGTVFEADGTNFPDALSAGTAAAALGGAILLTAGSAQSAETAAYLAAHAGDKRYAIGGPAAAADPTAKSYVGSDRFATSVMVAQAFFAAPTSIGLASALTFPDALSGGSVAAMNGGPIVLVPSNGALPASVSGYLTTVRTTATAAWLFGGPNSVNADVFNAAATILAAS